MIKNFLIFIFIVLGMIVVLNFSDHNLKRAVDACLAGSQKLSKSKIKFLVSFDLNWSYVLRNLILFL